MYSPATPPRPRLPLLDRMSVLGLRAGQLMAWQLIAAAAIVAVARPGPARWPLAAAAALGLSLTVPRWRHRWAYEWLLTAWSFPRARRAASGTSAASAALPLTVIPVRLRSGDEAGIVHDGDGFAVIVAVTPRRTSPPVTDLPIAALAGLLDTHDSLVSAVQVVVHGDSAASEPGSGPARAYRELGYHHVPRSQSVWIALRHDPTASGYAAGAAGTPAELHASLTRALAGRGLRAVDVLGDLGLSAQLLDAESAREVVHRALLAPEPVNLDEIAAQSRPAHRWGSWHSATRGHVTFWLRRWPPSGIHSLQQALAAVPALSATTAVIMTRGGGGRIGLTATVRVATEPGADQAAISRAVAAAAASCGARLVRLNGDHAAGVLATLPIGRGLATAVRWAGRHAEAAAGPPATVLPVAAGGVVLGADADGQPVAVPFFTAAGGTRAAVIGDPLLPRLLALRALASGARLHVVTSQSGGWLRMRSFLGLPAERMVIARPGTQPPSDGTRASPWMIIDETGSPAAAGSRPWQSVVTVPNETRDGTAALSGLDVILLRLITPPRAAAVIAAMSLTPSSAEALEQMPRNVVAVAAPGSVRFPLLTPDEAERAALAESLRAG